jgi:predicted dehydrogenase
VRSKLRVGVLGAGTWARFAHIPGWLRDPRADVVSVCDVQGERAEAAARDFGIGEATDDWQALLGRADLDVVDIVTPSHTHYELAEAALQSGKHVLCEKPVAYDFRQTRRLAAVARERGLKTKLGFTFRYSPGVQYARALLDDGFVGTPFIFNGYEQNSQWLDPQVPLRQVDPDADQSVLQTSSLEGYGAPIIDIGHWWVGADLLRVVGTLKNFIPERMVRATGRMMRMNIDDGDIFLGEYANGAIGSIQTSFVTVGNYPGVEARIYGERGAIICRLVEERGVAETISLARPDAVEFEQVEIPDRFYPAGGHARESWRSLFYANLIKDFLDEIEAGGQHNQGNFDDGAWVQEVINAVELSHHQRRWVELPLPAVSDAP